MTMIGSLLRIGRRELHTIISREIIQPCSPTPSHLKTPNLSILDQIGMNTFMPMVTFYPSSTGINRSSHDKTLDLKKSSSQTLTKHYPFAGRLAKVAPAYVDCNNDGAEFLEASIDSTLSDFLQKSQPEDLIQFFPDRQVWYKSNDQRGDRGDQVIPLAVQVNHFECGGGPVAVSLSHKIADGTSLIHFINDWAKLTRLCSKEQKHDQFPIDLEFGSYPLVNISFNGFLGPDVCVTRSFMFTNTKINELKLKLIAMTTESGQPITNPTRVDVLTWLLYKSAVGTTNILGVSKPTAVGHVINVRNKMMEPLPLNRIGNFFMIMQIQTELKPKGFINELKRQKMQFHGVRNIEAAFGLVPNLTSETAIEEQRFIDDAYISTSVCGYPVYDIDFGWGNPLKTTFAGNLRKNSFILMDAPNGDGIVALVCLGKQDMAIVQSDPELLAFC